MSLKSEREKLLVQHTMQPVPSYVTSKPTSGAGGGGAANNATNAGAAQQPSPKQAPRRKPPTPGRKKTNAFGIDWPEDKQMSQLAYRVSRLLVMLMMYDKPARPDRLCWYGAFDTTIVTYAYAC
jgi:hypothetical protein